MRRRLCLVSLTLVGVVLVVARDEAQADREFLTEEEVAEIERGAEDTNRTADGAEAVRTEAGGNVGAYNRFWLDFGTNVVEDGRTS